MHVAPLGFLIAAVTPQNEPSNGTEYPGAQMGPQVEAKFIGVDKKSRTISLSIKAKEAHEEAEAVQSYRSETAPSGTSLGDLLKEQIGSGER